MLQERLLDRMAYRLYYSRTARERVIQTYLNLNNNTPPQADAALVMGTSLVEYPDKFRKRVWIGTQLVLKGLVPFVIFSGATDHETRDRNQAYEAARTAIGEFGLKADKIHLVGGNNTRENLEQAAATLPQCSQVLIVSNPWHLMRTVYPANYMTRQGNGIYPEITWYPCPIPGEVIDPDDPRVIEALIKAVLYNRTVNKVTGQPDTRLQTQIDSIATNYEKLTRAMPQPAEMPFEMWRKLTESLFRSI